MISRLISNIKKTDAPIVVGLDPMLSYIPDSIKNEAYAEFGETLEGAAEAVWQFNKKIMITFALYLIALVYFLFFSESYGRTVVANTYHYNLIPFKEIRRFWDNRALLGAQVVFTNLFGNVIAFMTRSESTAWRCA